jgi:hypothetical protein
VSQLLKVIVKEVVSEFESIPNEDISEEDLVVPPFLVEIAQ